MHVKLTSSSDSLASEYATTAVAGMYLIRSFSLHAESQRGTALVFYEYIITFRREIATVWNRKITFTSALLPSTRYTLVLSQVIGIIKPSPAVSNLCVVVYA